jgi:hypothetical protein
MKKFLLNTIVLLIFWGVLYYVTVFITIRTVNLDPINGIKPFFFSLFVFSILYKIKWDFSTFKRVKSAAVLVFLFLVFFYFSNYIYGFTLKSRIFFNEITAEKYRGWKGITQKQQDSMGFVPVPNGRGFHVFPIGEDIPMAYNSQGFRVALSDTDYIAEPGKVDVLFLGCSFTYGDACYAEETFAYKVGKLGSYKIINAGICSYGLNQMYLLSKQLIKKFKPRYTVIQYSPWLVERATSFGAPANGFLPVPYFFDKDDSIALQYPVEKAETFNINRQLLREKHQNRYFKFMKEFGLWYLLKEDAKQWHYHLPKWLGGPPSPSTDRKKVAKVIYNNIANEAVINNSKPIFLLLGSPDYSGGAQSMITTKGAQLVNADTILWRGLKRNNTDAYNRKYGHWRKNNSNDKDSVLVDTHPNPLAHTIIAQEILKIIKK